MTTDDPPPPPPPRSKKPLPPPPTYENIKYKQQNKQSSESHPIPVVHANPPRDGSSKCSISYDDDPILMDDNDEEEKNIIIADNRMMPPPLLAVRQSSLPVLLVPTLTANSNLCEKKNGVSLSQLLNTIGGSVVGLNTNFRSVSKSFLLDSVDLRFVQGKCVNPLLLSRDNEKASNVLEDQLARLACPLEEDDGNITDQELDDRVLHELQLELSQTKPDNGEFHDSGLPLQDSAERGTQLLARSNLPWFRRLRLLLDSSTNNMSHEMLGYPVVVLLVASSSDLDFIECFRELMVNHHLPRPFHVGHYDPGTNLRRYFVLLHDNVDGPKDFNEQLATNLFHKTFPGQPFRVLRLNSVPKSSQQKNKQPDIWSTESIGISFDSDENTVQERCKIMGKCLSPDDMISIRSFVFDLTKNGIIPEMERRIFNLNVDVSNAKRGVRNAIKSFWRKPKENDGRSLLSLKQLDGVYVVKYAFDQIESQVRLLADSLFLVKDYDAALSVYRLVKGDYSSDKATLYFGSINEMIALCLYISDPIRNNREIFTAIENALFSYARASEENRFSSQQGKHDTKHSPAGQSTGILVTRLASRLALVACASDMTESRHFDYAECLAGASVQEVPLIAAVLLEQAALNYFQASLFRKYAFHVVMAGHMYRAGKQEQHGTRCFTAAMHFYRQARWGPLYSHLQSSLAHQAYALNKLNIALQVYVRLASSRDMSARIQEKVLQNLFEICKNAPKDTFDGMTSTGSRGASRIEHANNNVLEIPSLELPMIVDKSIEVISGPPVKFDTDQNGINNEVAFDAEITSSDDLNLWDEMTDCLEAELHSSKNSHSIASFAKIVESEKQKRVFNSKLSTKPMTRALEEPFVVALDLFNPLSMPLSLNCLQLIARHEDGENVCSNVEPKMRTAKEGERHWSFNGSAETFHEPDFLCHSINTKVAFVVNKQNISIPSKSFTKVYLHICPLISGKLRILGMRCKLFNQVWVFHEFNVPGPLLQKTREQRANRERGESHLLECVVGENMSRLIATIEGGKESALQGEVMEWKLHLRNIGLASARNILLKSNLPWLCLLSNGDQRDVSKATSSCVGASGTAIWLSKNTDIKPGTSATFRIKARVSGGGRKKLHLLLRYDTAFQTDALPSSWNTTRYLRKTLFYTVYPALSMSASCQPSFIENGKYLLCVEITNYRSDEHSNENVELSYLGIASDKFQANFLPGQVSTNETLKLGWQERASFLFTLQSVSEQHPQPLLTEIQFLINQGDINTSPQYGGDIFDFLCLENSFESFNLSVETYKQERALTEQSDKPRSIHEIRRANENKSSGGEALTNQSETQPTSISSLFSTRGSMLKSELSVVCHWNSKGCEEQRHEIHGEHFICNFPVQRDDVCPFTITGKYPPKISHDFHSKPQLEIDMEITIRNHLLNSKPISFTFEIIPDTESKSFHFIGVSNFQWELNCEETLIVPLRVAFTSSGVFDIQSLRLTSFAKDSEHKPERSIAPYLFDEQWIVRVNT